MRLLTSLFLSLLAMTSVSADGMGEFKNNAAKIQANTARQNTIQVTESTGVFLQSRSTSYTAATNGSAAITAYDEVDIVAGTFPDDAGKGKVEIQIDNLNITQTGAGKKANLNIQNFAFAWRPFSIVQYVENAAIQNGFDGNDTLCHEYAIRPSTQNAFKFKWINSTVVQADNNGGNVTLHTFQGSTADGVFGIIIKATGTVGASTLPSTQVAKTKSIWIDNRFVEPTSIKFDVLVNVTQPAFKLNTTAKCTNYQIAIKSWARSSQEVFARNSVTKQTINGTNTTTTTTTTTFLDRIQTGGAATPFGFFTWSPTAAAKQWIDANTTAQVTTNVLATSLLKVQNNEDHDDKPITKEAIHSFDVIRPLSIQWDPELGSDLTNPDVADPSSTGISTGTSATDAPSTSSTAAVSSTASVSPSSVASSASSSSSTGAGSGKNPNHASTVSASIAMLVAAVMAMLA